MVKALKEKIIGSAGSVSGFASVLGSWQVCHNICLVIIAILGIMGITLVGMPLQFFTKIAPYIWTIALILILVTLILYIKKKCISSRLILFNSGLVIAGIPFESLQKFSKLFFLIGGALSISAIILFIKDRSKKKEGCCHE
jgi:hypothetical protein